MAKIISSEELFKNEPETITTEELFSSPQLQETSSFEKNALKDLGENVKGMVAQAGQSAKTVAGLGADIFTGGQAERIGLPSSKQTINEVAGQIEPLKQEYANRYGGLENIKKTAHEKPISMVMDIMTLLGGVNALRGKGNTVITTKEGVKPSVLGGISKETNKSTQAGQLPTSRAKLLSGNLEHSTLENMVKDKDIRKNVAGGYVKELAENFETDFNNTLHSASKEFDSLRKGFYDKAGITDNTKVNVANPTFIKEVGQVERGEPISPITHIDNKINDFALSATTTDDLKALKDAQDISNRIKQMSNKGELTYGVTKKFTNKLWDLSEKNKTNQGAMTETSRLFGDMRKALVEARDNIPELKTASKEYHKLNGLEDKLGELLKIQNEPGEINAARKIERRYKDLGNTEFKEQLDSLGDLLQEYKDAPALQGLVSKIKMLQTATNIDKAKGIKIPYLSKVPILKHFMPEISAGKYAQLIAKGLDSGIIKGDKLLEEIQPNRNMLWGGTATKVGAIKDVLGINLPSISKPNIPMTAKTMSIVNILNLGQKKDEENSFLNR